LVVPNLSIRAAIEEARRMLHAGEKGEIDTIITCGGGMFARTGLIKAGQELVGKIHLKEHINIMSFGDITVVTEEGGLRLTGFNIMACKPGTRRFGHAWADTLWTTILQTDETDLARVEELFFAKDHNELESDNVC
jgi:hypothetical protein